MHKIYFTKELKLSLKTDFKSDIFDKVKTEFYNNYMKGESWFFIKDYKNLLTLNNLKNEGYNEIITFSEIDFDTESYNFDKPIAMKESNKFKPNFPFLPFIAKSVDYTIQDSDDLSFDLVDSENNTIKITKEYINQYNLVHHKL